MNMRKLKITLLGGFILCIGLSLFLVSSKKEDTKDLKLGINRPSVSKTSKKETIDQNGLIIVAFLRTLSINMFILVDITMRSLCPSSYSFSLETSYYLHKEALLVIFKSLLVIIESRPFAEILKKQYLCTSHSL